MYEEQDFFNADEAFARDEDSRGRVEMADPVYVSRHSTTDCAPCAGSGIKPGTEHAACGECGGTGVDVGSLHEPEQCPVCLGRGYDLEPDVAELQRVIARHPIYFPPESNFIVRPRRRA